MFCSFISRKVRFVLGKRIIMTRDLGISVTAALYVELPLMLLTFFPVHSGAPMDEALKFEMAFIEIICKEQIFEIQIALKNATQYFVSVS